MAENYQIQLLMFEKQYRFLRVRDYNLRVHLAKDCRSSAYKHLILPDDQDRRHGLS